ncbi:MAG: 16S rRNA (cytidine(1402)-2'-O)-methyltransferase, partial [Mailhella sp.]|nr:16S rRNA (cytidine(1402)-2'-O)-methyltransferase [Mailhella sp.]
MSSPNNTFGKLCIVATPLGNAGDLSPRARKILEEVPLVLAEDTKRAGLNFARWGLKAKRFISFNDHSEEKKLEHALNFLQQGEDIALIS